MYRPILKEIREILFCSTAFLWPQARETEKVREKSSARDEMRMDMRARHFANSKTLSIFIILSRNT